MPDVWRSDVRNIAGTDVRNKNSGPAQSDDRGRRTLSIRHRGRVHDRIQISEGHDRYLRSHDCSWRSLLGVDERKAIRTSRSAETAFASNSLSNPDSRHSDVHGRAFRDRVVRICDLHQ